MKNKNALIVSNSLGLVTAFLENDIKILNAKNYKLTIVCNVNYPDVNSEKFLKQYPNIEIINIPFPIRNMVFNEIYESFKALKNVLRKNKYDMIHCHSTIAAAITRIILFTCFYKTELIYTSHGFPFYCGVKGIKPKIYYCLEKILSYCTDAIITICNEDYENAKKMYCKSVYKINGVGVNLKRFYECNVSKMDYRNELSIPQDKKVILSIGELNTNKNHKAVIEAIGKINDNQIIYIICGREVTEKGKMHELESLSKKNGVKTIFLGFRNDIPEICKCADIGIIPSFKEGLGLAGIEMLASGIPLAGSNRQGIRDYIHENTTGFLFDPNNVDTIVEAIKKTFEIAGRVDVFNNCIRESKRFGKEEAYANMKNIYDELGI